MKEILLSMKPGWFNMVVSGEKLYEYRKHFPEGKVRAYIYVTSPIKAIEAIFEFGERINLLDLKSKDYVSQDMLSKIDYYLENSNYAVPILKVYRTCKVDLNHIRHQVKGFIAPQMYYFLREESKLTDFIHGQAQIIGQPIYENILEKISKDALCKNFDRSEVRNMGQLSLFDDPNFLNNNKEKQVDKSKILN